MSRGGSTQTTQTTRQVSQQFALEDTSGLTLQGLEIIDSEFSISDPQAVAGIKDVALESIQTIPKAIDFGGDVVEEAFEFAKFKELSTIDIIDTVQQSNLESQQKIAESRRSETAATFENIAKIVVFGGTAAVIVIAIARRKS